MFPNFEYITSLDQHCVFCNHAVYLVVSLKYYFLSLLVNLSVWNKKFGL